jgi:RIO-like serine/threonine protein kinase
MITLPNDNRIGGAHGSYVKLSPSLGVKIIHSVKFNNIAKAYRSRAYRNALREAYILNVAFESGVVPRCYGVTLVRVKKGYRVGVLMQHLGSTPLFESEFCDKFSEAFDEINDRLIELGIVHNDIHDENVMVYRGKFYVIDFSPDCVKMK